MSDNSLAKIYTISYRYNNKFDPYILFRQIQNIEDGKTYLSPLMKLMIRERMRHHDND